MDGRFLCIHGEKKESRKESGLTWRFSERKEGFFDRRILMPGSVTPSVY